MTRAPNHPGWAAGTLGATSLLGTALLSTGWVFGKYPNLAAALNRGEATAAQVGDASPSYLLLHTLTSPDFVRWLQAGAAAATVAVLFLTLHRQAGALAAWLGAGALALAQSWLIYSAVMEPDCLIGCAVTLSLASIPPATEARWWRLALPGLALGFAISLRPTSLLLAVLVLGFLGWKKTPPRLLAAFALSALFAGALPSLLLRARFGSELSATMSAGQVFHQSHRPESVGFAATFPSLLKIVEAQEMASGPHPPDFAHELYRELAQVSDPSRLEPTASEAFWVGKSFAFFQLEPLAALGQLLHKAVFFIAPPSTESDIPAVQPLLHRNPGLPLRWLALLAAGSLALLALRRNAAALPWALQWAASLAVALLFYFHGRYAVGLVPSLAALTGLGLSSAWKERGPHAAILALPLLLLGLPSVRWNDRMNERLSSLRSDAPPAEQAKERYLDEQAALPDVFWPTSPHGVGVGFDDAELARAAAERAVSRYGTSNAVDATLAAALWAQAGRCDTAIELADTASDFTFALGDSAIDPQLIASDCLLSLGRPTEALERLERTNHQHPGRVEVLARLVAAGDTGHATDVDRWEDELESLHDAATVHFVRAKARRRWGDPQGAIDDADWLAAHWPRAQAFAAHERALALLDLHQDQPAMEAWVLTVPVRAALPGQSRFDALVAQLTEDPSTDARVKALALVHWKKRGNQERIDALTTELKSRR